jgi:hypothetical protein
MWGALGGLNRPRQGQGQGLLHPARHPRPLRFGTRLQPPGRHRPRECGHGPDLSALGTVIMEQN